MTAHPGGHLRAGTGTLLQAGVLWPLSPIVRIFHAGGLIASRGAGHQSNKYGKAEDWLIAARVVTPRGVWNTEAFPKSAAGPLLRDLTPGSEGVFGIIADARVHIHEVPEVKEYRAYFFQDFGSGVRTQYAASGGATAMVRLSDANETFFYSVMHGGAEVAANGPAGFCLMRVGFEGAADGSSSRSVPSPSCPSGQSTWVVRANCGYPRFETPYLRDPPDHGLGVDTVRRLPTGTVCRNAWRRPARSG